MKVTDTLRQHFAAIGLTTEAAGWLVDLWSVTQGLDDWRDGDEVSPEECHDVVYKLLVSMPCNPFYVRHQSILAPALSQMVIKWVASNALEDAQDVSETSFVWRAGYYDVVTAVVTAEMGYKVAMELSPYILKMYGESYEDYLEEFNNA